MATPRRRRIRLGLLIFWSLVVAWMFWNMQPKQVAATIFESTAGVEVTRSSDALTFTPAVDTAKAGLIFYPGALVHPDAYAPFARAVAEAGYQAVILPLPWRLAPTGAQQAALAARTLAHIQADERSWVLSGHSRGGALAAQLAPDLANHLDGLLLIGTSHPKEHDLSALQLDVTKIYATEDGLASVPEVEGFASNLPETTHWVRIDGGNHSQFGWYGWQLGAGTATISQAEQHAQTVAATLDQLARVAR
ncbi:MAG: alpha/beta hydrolase [Rhodothermales bacterium]